MLTFRKGKKQPDWLDKKVALFNRYWKLQGEKIFKKVTNLANFEWPSKLVESGITVYVKSDRKSEYLGLIFEDHPEKIDLFIKKSYKFSRIRSALIHELLHSIMWARIKDGRIKGPSLFEDFFADEIIVSIVEKLANLNRSLTKKDCEDALLFGIDQAKERLNLRSLKRRRGYQGLLDYLLDFSNNYRKNIKNSDILKERKKVNQNIPSPIMFEM